MFRRMTPPNPSEVIPNPTPEDFMADFIGYKLTKKYDIEDKLKDEQRKCAERQIGYSKDEAFVCTCKLGNEKQKKCNDGSCHNRATFIACPSSCGDFCCNNPWKGHGQWQIGINTYLFYHELKGYGIKASSPIPSGAWVAPYFGKVGVTGKRVTPPEAADYLLELNGVQQFVNPYTKGNGASIINHSCNPNCEASQFFVKGKIYIAIVSNKLIQKDEEITFDYKRTHASWKKATECKCGEQNCRGFIEKE